MITSPEPSVSLTEEDARKLELGTARLKVVQAEVLDATKNLAALQEETATVTQHKEYQEQLFATLTAQIHELEAHKLSLEGHLATNKRELERVLTESGEIHTTHNARDEKLSAHERNMMLSLAELNEKQSKLDAFGTKLEAERAEVEHARLAFLDAIETVRWK